MDAQGALDSLVGRLTTILVDEAQLLGGLRGDVEFIKDEMESMNSLLMYLTEAQHRNHQVRTWMKHVVGLSRDCEGNVELYVRYVAGADPRANRGFLGYVRRVLRLLRTIPARHRVATRIRELKVRARDVGERRLRYGVTVPSGVDQDDVIFTDEVQGVPAPGDEEDVRRRALLDCSEDEDTFVKKGIDEMIKLLLSEEVPAANKQGQPQPRAFCMLYPSVCPSSNEVAIHNEAVKIYADDINRGGLVTVDRIARGVYEHPSVVASFSCKDLVCASATMIESKVQLLREILQQVSPPLPAGYGDSREMSTEDLEAIQLSRILDRYLTGKRALIMVEHVPSCSGLMYYTLPDVAAHVSPDSAIIITTDSLNKPKSTYRIFNPENLYSAFCSKAEELIGGSARTHIETILGLCYPDVLAMKMFLHLLYVNPRRGTAQLDNFAEILVGCRQSNKNVAKQMVRLSYNDLPARFRSCLLYLTVFPEGDPIRRTTLFRRWIAEGLIVTRENRLEDEAGFCFDALLSWGLIQPGEISDTGKIKTCTLHQLVREVITRIARDVNFVDTDLPLDLACHLSVHSRTGVLASRSVEAADRNGIVAFFQFLTKSSQWQLLKLLDLEGCKGMEKHHLKSICEILLLKYLSLRKTDVTEIPKEIKKLQCLETLDIRETPVRAFAPKSIMLPMLKHLLAGNTESPSNSSDRFQESFTAVCLPSGIREMEKLETLSHVEVSHRVHDLIDVGHLLQLRKLGVILHAKKGALALLFRQIEKLHGCLRSLSIQVNQPIQIEGTAHAEEVVALATPPKFLQSVNISGITSGLLLWIAELDQLTKITLSETYLGENYIRILGKLTALRCLRLRRNSYAGSELGFKEDEFKSLKSLVVNDDVITNITFDSGAAPQLERIVWSFDKMESLSGVLFLTNLRKLELSGDCDPDPVKQALEDHPNHPDFKHKPCHPHHEDEAVVAASTT